MNFAERVEHEIALAKRRHDEIVHRITRTDDALIADLRQLDAKRRVQQDIAATLFHVRRMFHSAEQGRGNGQTRVAILVEKHPLVAPHVERPSSQYSNGAYLRKGHTMTLEDLVTAWRDALRDGHYTRPWMRQRNTPQTIKQIRNAEIDSVGDRYRGNRNEMALVRELSRILGDESKAEVSSDLLEQLRIDRERKAEQARAAVRSQLHASAVREHSISAAMMLNPNPASQLAHV